jgi:hypothetical protein
VADRRELALMQAIPRPKLVGSVARWAFNRATELSGSVLGRIEDKVAERIAERRLETAPAGVPTAPPARRTPAQLMHELLERSLVNTREQAQADWFEQVLAALTPDEARIFAALSDGDAFPLIHVAAGNLMGATRRVLENISTIGSKAGVQLQEMTPTYVAHLRALGVVETGPEDPEQKVQYEILSAGDVVRKTIEQIKKDKQRDTIIRRTLRISATGRDLWAACQIV